ncbi:FimV/HubP family polar landmark protein [Haliea atlantica]
MARKRTLAAALATVGYLQVAPAWSLGLGEITLHSFLNEPLRASVNLINAGNLHEDQIRVRLATSEDFDRLGVERAYFLTSIKFEVRLDEQGNSEILLTSEDPVLEPYLDFILEARWPAGRLLRNYTVLVDPPAQLPGSRTVSAREQLKEEEPAAPASASTAVPEPAPAVTRGDRVDVRESGLAPGEMPRRPYSAGTADAPQPGARYMIRRDETLWTIAQRARPEGASVQQTMLEIQRLNPEAFIDGNINRIKAGYIIYLPERDDMSRADVEAIREQIRQQNADWRAGRASDPEASRAALRLASGDDGAATQPPAEPASAAVPAGQASDGRDPAREEAPGAPATAASAAAEEAAAGAPPQQEAQLARAEQERDALASQLNSLGERLASLERMVTLRDAQIAELQAALAEAQARPATDTDTQVVTPQQQPVVEEAEEGSRLWWYGLGAAAIAALLGLLAWRRREADEDKADTATASGGLRAAAGQGASSSDAFAGVELRDQDVELDLDEEMAAAAPVVAPGKPTAGPQRGYGERKHDQYAADVEASDALAEADIYVAYGRFPQAMELLRKAISADPDNAAFRLRLLELAVETGNRAEAEEQLEALRGIGDGGSIEAAENLMLGGAVFDHRGVAAGAEPAEAAEADDLAADLAAVYGAAEDAGPGAGATGGEQAFARSPAADSHFQGNLSEYGSGEDPVEDLSEELPDLSPPGDGLDEQVPAVGDDEPEFLGLEIEEGDEELDLTRDSGPATSDEDDFVFADDGDPIATKLDLARAYIDMGDEEGAREILEEVLQVGSAEQQQDARTLLDRLG